MWLISETVVQPFFKRFLLIATLLTATLLIGTSGFMWVEGWQFFDSLYMTLITLTTVGYGEVHPLTFRGRVFVSVLMLVGVTTVFVSIAVMGETFLRLEMTDYFGRKRRDRMLKNISGHYIVCGAGRVGRSVIHELLRSHASVVVIDDSVDRARWGTDKGVITLVGDATKDEVLREARIDTAKGLVAAISSDAENVYVTLSAKVLNPDLVVAARASDDQAKKNCGAPERPPCLRPIPSLDTGWRNRCCGPTSLPFSISLRHSGNPQIWTWRSNNFKLAGRVRWSRIPSSNCGWRKTTGSLCLPFSIKQA